MVPIHSHLVDRKQVRLLAIHLWLNRLIQLLSQIHCLDLQKLVAPVSLETQHHLVAAAFLVPDHPKMQVKEIPFSVHHHQEARFLVDRTVCSEIHKTISSPRVPPPISPNSVEIMTMETMMIFIKMKRTKHQQ